MARVEAYFNFSLGKISGKPSGFGPVEDAGILFGINYGADENVQKYLPGVRFSLWREGLAFANLDLTAYIDNNGAHLLAQPQFRWDAGKAWFDAPGQLSLGFEYQYWQNKLGDEDTDESAMQFLAV